MFKPLPPIHHNAGLTNGQFLAITMPLALIGASLLMATVLGLISWDGF